MTEEKKVDEMEKISLCTLEGVVAQRLRLELNDGRVVNVEAEREIGVLRCYLLKGTALCITV